MFWKTLDVFVKKTSVFCGARFVKTVWKELF